MPPQLSADQKELLLLWIMITANKDYQPGPNTPNQILTKIATAFVAAGGPAGWFWPNLNKQTIPASTQIATVLATSACSIVPLGPPPEIWTKQAEYNDVILDFKTAASALTSAGGGSPWPPSAPGTDHPTVAEIKAALQM